MSVSAIRTDARRGATFCRSRRARRFWGAMAVALRETARRPGEALTEELNEQAAGIASYEASWRLPVAA